MNSKSYSKWTRWFQFMKKTRGRKSRETVTLRLAWQSSGSCRRNSRDYSGKDNMLFSKNDTKKPVLGRAWPVVRYKVVVPALKRQFFFGPCGDFFYQDNMLPFRLKSQNILRVLPYILTPEILASALLKRPIEAWTLRHHKHMAAGILPTSWCCVPRHSLFTPL